MRDDHALIQMPPSEPRWSRCDINQHHGCRRRWLLLLVVAMRCPVVAVGVLAMLLE